MRDESNRFVNMVVAAIKQTGISFDEDEDTRYVVEVFEKACVCDQFEAKFHSTFKFCPHCGAPLENTFQLFYETLAITNDEDAFYIIPRLDQILFAYSEFENHSLMEFCKWYIRADFTRNGAAKSPEQFALCFVMAQRFGMHWEENIFEWVEMP